MILSVLVQAQQAINAATRRCWIFSPYFVPDVAVIKALQLAAMRGVDVRILIPANPDKRVVWWAAHSYLFEVAVAGVRMYTYREGFMHQKVFLVDDALAGIKELGVTHIWYTGVPHHALINDYTEFGISNDDPDVVKGRAGSPYAVKDYYNVNPDLAEDPGKRLEGIEVFLRHQFIVKFVTTDGKTAIEVALEKSRKDIEEGEGVPEFRFPEHLDGVRELFADAVGVGI